MFAALQLGDPTSFLAEDATFTPLPVISHNGTFGLPGMINAALGR